MSGSSAMRINLFIERMKPHEATCVPPVLELARKLFFILEFKRGGVMPGVKSYSYPFCRFDLCLKFFYYRRFSLPSSMFVGLLFRLPVRSGVVVRSSVGRFGHQPPSPMSPNRACILKTATQLLVATLGYLVGSACFLSGVQFDSELIEVVTDLSQPPHQKRRFISHYTAFDDSFVTVALTCFVLQCLAHSSISGKRFSRRSECK